ncbi:MAG: DUF4416 family protein [Deltaproteobacteria bacterium]|jgi:hypothetical protein|nr:DUF4416 family protein [Deltaproteobacteria bacterium]
MSQLADPQKVKFFLAAFGRDPALLTEAVSLLGSRFEGGLLGRPDIVSQDRFFSETAYYEPEMGSGLLKRYLSWPNLAPPDFLVPLKHLALELEASFSEDGRRRVNLDPGYVFAGGLVLSTGKFSGHRLYLGQKVWGELTVHYHRGQFQFLPWTYRDYRSPEVIGLLTRMRRDYLAGLNSSED